MSTQSPLRKESDEGLSFPGNVVSPKVVASQSCPNLPLEKDGSLMKHLSKQSHTILFLRLNGLVWSTESQDENSIVTFVQCMWSMLMRLILVGYFGFNIQFIVANNTGAMGFFDIIFSTILIAQTIVLFPSIHEMMKRLKNETALYDIQFYRASLKWCYLCFGSTFSVSCLYYALIKYYNYPMTSNEQLLNVLPFIMLFGLFSTSCYLAANLLFIVVDCKVSAALIDYLSHLQQQNTLTIDIFNEVRSEIKHRVKSSKRLNYALVFVAIFNIFGIVLVILMTKHYAAFITIGMMSLFLKEFPFLLVIFYFSAVVNEKSDMLTKSLGSNKWDIEQNNGVRMALYINAESSRISFPLAELRMNYKDVRRQIIGWIIATAVAIAKTLLGR